jgi:hypothetical protein
MAPFERELTAFLASVEGASGNLDESLAALDEVASRAAADRDTISEAWARIVSAQLLVAAGRPAAARPALAAAQQVLGTFDYPYGQNVGSRLSAVLATHEQGWPASREPWRAAVDRNAASGDLGELALTLRAAAALAAQAGDREAATALLDAVPAGEYVTVLGDVFAGAPRPQGGAVRGNPGSPVVALHRARALLAPPPAPGTGPDVGEARAADGRRSRVAAEGRAASGASAAATAPDAALCRAGDGWTVRFAGRSVQVRQMKGLEDLAVLLVRPSEDVHCLELMGSGAVSQSGVPGLDDRARRAYQARVRELQLEIDEARDANDSPRAERAEAELDALVQQLSASFGLGGRERKTGSTAERARSAVTWRIRTAIKRLREIHPELGRHLGNAIRTGTWCTYQPETAIEWKVEDG